MHFYRVIFFCIFFFFVSLKKNYRLLGSSVKMYKMKETKKKYVCLDEKREILPAIVCDLFGWFIEIFHVVGNESDQKKNRSLAKRERDEKGDQKW